MNARQLITYLTESTIRGEYWIEDGGYVKYCDGDIGDTNHEGYAMQHACILVADHIGVNFDDNYSSEELARLAKETYLEDADEDEAAAAEELDDNEVLELMVKEANVPDGEKLVNIAYGIGDPREYAVKHWGWHAVRGTNVETNAITPESLKEIARGINDILDEEGIDDGDDDGALDELVLNIGAYTGKLYLEISYRDLEAGNYGLATPVQPAPAQSAQVRQMDVDAVPKTYKGNLGDSLRR